MIFKKTEAEKLHFSRPRMAETLHCLNGWFKADMTLDLLLQEVTTLIVDLLKVECCTITWLNEDKKMARIRANYNKNGVNGLQNGNGYWFSSWTQDVTLRSRYFGEQFDSTDESLCPMESFPIRVKDEVLGHLHVVVEQRNNKVAQDRNSLLTGLVEHLGFAIEMQQIRRTVVSRYAKIRGRTQQNSQYVKDSLHSHILKSVHNPERIARIIARSFFKDLRKAGFETKQILIVASELIGRLNKTFRNASESREIGDPNNAAS